MSFQHGKGSQLLMDENDLSAWFRSLDLSADVDAADTTTFTKSWKTFIPGLISGAMEGSGIHDADQQNVKATLQAATDSVLTFSPGKATALGDPARLLVPRSTSMKESSPVGDVVAFDWSAQADGTLGFGRLWHPLAEETSTSTSSYIDGGAASSTGAVAHLHITDLVGDTDLLVEFSDCATPGGSYVAITGGAFTLATGVGAQRLEIPGTIRRYVKATWTITGSTPSVTFAVAMART